MCAGIAPRRVRGITARRTGGRPRRRAGGERVAGRESGWRVGANELLGEMLGEVLVKTYLENYCKRVARRVDWELAQESFVERTSAREPLGES